MWFALAFGYPGYEFTAYTMGLGLESGAARNDLISSNKENIPVTNSTPTTDTSEQEIAGVAFDPRHLLTITVVLGLVAWWFLPLSFLPGLLSTFLGPLVTAAAFGLFFWAGATMSKANTAVPVNEPTTAIVDDGPFKFSRNPTYVAIIVLQIGLAIWTNSLWFVALAVLSVILLNRGVIVREEEYLVNAFGHDYLSYKDRVRRWL